MTSDFEGRVALVTGGSRGIGCATALRLAREGANVAISYGSRKDKADEVVREIESIGRRAIAAACDVSQPDQVDSLVKATNEQLGTIGFLIHCGAISNICDHNSLSYEVWRETIDVNLNGTYSIVFAVKDQMIRERFGRIVVISSIAALRPRAMQIHYASAKAGVIALTRCCAEAFAPHDVRINCIAPGLIETEMMHVLPKEKIAEVVSQTPMKRVGQPDEIAAMARFLLSDQSSFTTGQTFVASGGRVMLP